MDLYFLFLNLLNLKFKRRPKREGVEEEGISVYLVRLGKFKSTIQQM